MVKDGERREEKGREGEEERRYSLVESESEYKCLFILTKEGERDCDAM
jgi:hypothetical protein